MRSTVEAGCAGSVCRRVACALPCDYVPPFPAGDRPGNRTASQPRVGLGDGVCAWGEPQVGKERQKSSLTCSEVRDVWQINPLDCRNAIGASQ